MKRFVKTGAGVPRVVSRLMSAMFDKPEPVDEIHQAREQLRATAVAAHNQVRHTEDTIDRIRKSAIIDERRFKERV